MQWWKSIIAAHRLLVKLKNRVSVCKQNGQKAFALSPVSKRTVARTTVPFRFYSEKSCSCYSFAYFLCIPFICIRYGFGMLRWMEQHSVANRRRSCRGHRIIDDVGIRLLRLQWRKCFCFGFGFGFGLCLCCYYCCLCCSSNQLNSSLEKHFRGNVFSVLLSTAMYYSRSAPYIRQDTRYIPGMCPLTTMNECTNATRKHRTDIGRIHFVV